MPKETAPSDPSAYDDDELVDILKHIDRAANPERYQAIRDEYVRRHGDRVNGQPIDAYFDRARRVRPFAERGRFKKRMLIAFAIWGLLMLTIRAAMYLFSKHPGP